MKEINLLPQWYRNKKRRQILWRTEYVALGCLFLMMLVWNCWTAHYIAKTSSELDKFESSITNADVIAKEFSMYIDRISALQKKATILDEIDSKIDVACVLAEMSFLFDEKVVIRGVDFTAEKFSNEVVPETKGISFLTAVKSASAGTSGNKRTGGIRFKITVSGLAADAGNVAELICKLEESPYFWLVYPVFSRNTKTKVADRLRGENAGISEFRIGCYLANYRYDEPVLVKENLKKIM